MFVRKLFADLFATQVLQPARGVYVAFVKGEKSS